MSFASSSINRRPHSVSSRTFVAAKSDISSNLSRAMSERRVAFEAAKKDKKQAPKHDPSIP